MQRVIEEGEDMSTARILFPLFAALGLAACGTSSLQTRVEQLEMERQDLLRRNGELKTEVTTYRARCDSLQTALRKRPVKTGRTDGTRLPDDLRGKGIGIKHRAGETVIDIPSDVFFRSGVSDISKSGRSALGKVANFIRKNYPGSTFRIEGHADSDPIRRTKGRYHCNWELSLKRAHSVLHYLVDKASFNARDIIVAGYGSQRPQDPGNKARNRRVEIVIVQR